MGLVRAPSMSFCGKTDATVLWAARIAKAAFSCGSSGGADFVVEKAENEELRVRRLGWPRFRCELSSQLFAFSAVIRRWGLRGQWGLVPPFLACPCGAFPTL